jgi:hypothetical protein
LDAWNQEIEISVASKRILNIFHYYPNYKERFISLFSHLLATQGNSDGRRGVTFRLNETGFPRARKVRHHYDANTMLMLDMGASVSATLQHIYDQQVGEHKLDKIVAAITQKISHIKTQFKDTSKLQEVLNFLSSNINVSNTSSLIAKDFKVKWFMGEHNFIPAANLGWSSDILSFSRDCLLQTCESTPALFNYLVNLDPISLALSMYWAEQQVQVMLFNYLNSFFPGIILRD